MRRKSLFWRLAAVLGVLCCEAGPALASTIEEPESVAADVMVSLHDFVRQFGAGGYLLFIDPATGVLSENALIGTTTDLNICRETVLAHTNFKDKVGDEVIGHFIMAKVGKKLRVLEYVFGDDPTLSRLQQPACQYWSSDIPKLRLTILP